MGSEGLRVLALLGVSAFHIRPDVVPGGFLGVVIFFVLAGFYTTRSFVVRKELNFRHYYGGRFTRLWPPLLFMIALVTLFSGFVIPEVFPFLKRSALPSVLAYQNIAQSLADQSYFNRYGVFDPLIHLWALSIEMQFYIIYPLLYILLSKTADNFSDRLRPYGREMAAVFFAFLSFLSTLWMFLNYDPSIDPTRVYYSSIGRMNAFLVGAAANLWIAGRQMRMGLAGKRRRGTPLWAHTLFSWLSLVLLVLGFFIFDFQSSFLFRGGFFLYAWLTVVYIYFGGVKPVPGMGFMNRGIFRWLASRSYPLYLWQYALMILVEATLRFSKAGFGLRLCLQLIPLCLLAELSYRLFDKADALRPGFRAFFSLVLALITGLMLLLPPPVAAKAPALDSENVMASIESNRQRNESLVSEAPAPLPTHFQTAETPSETTETSAPTFPPIEDGENPYDFSPETYWKLRDLKAAAIGDSVLAMAMDGLYAYIPGIYIDAEVSRHLYQAPELIAGLTPASQGYDILIVALATNGDISSDLLEMCYEEAGGTPMVFVNTVVPGNWEQPNNEKLDAFAAAHRDVIIADWYAAAKEHPEYFYQDATHPIPDGAEVYDQVILKAVAELLTRLENEAAPEISEIPDN